MGLQSQIKKKNIFLPFSKYEMPIKTFKLPSTLNTECETTIMSYSIQV